MQRLYVDGILQWEIEKEIGPPWSFRPYIAVTIGPKMPGRIGKTPGLQQPEYLGFIDAQIRNFYVKNGPVP